MCDLSIAKVDTSTNSRALGTFPDHLPPCRNTGWFRNATDAPL